MNIDKDLLLKDLCARLPYDVKLSYRCNHIHVLKGIHKSGLVIINDIVTNVITTTDVENIAQYLFPLSSMTEKKKEEYCQLQQKIIYNSKEVVNKDITEYINWCYKNHLDINDLIPKGLAIDATGKNIY